MTDVRDDLVGAEIAGGRYVILDRIGEGSMGLVYRARDRRLDAEVVFKFPITAEGAPEGTDLLERFKVEVRSLVRMSHPHIVKIIDVGDLDGRPYVVMQYLSGGSLKDRIRAGPEGEPLPSPPRALRDWLPDVARALDSIHDQDHIHRDVKPANILFDAHGNAYLGDFGIIKALSAEAGEAWRDSSLTAPGFLLGTPNYVAPELVMGLRGDGRADQYSLALTVHEFLIGCNAMSGPSPSATLVNQTKVEAPALEEILPGVSYRLSEAVRRGLSKDPAARFPTCAAFAHEVLAGLPDDEWDPVDGGETICALPSLVPCPSCHGPMSPGPRREGETVRCGRCGALAVVFLSDGALKLKPAAGSSSTWPPVPVAGAVSAPSARPVGFATKAVILASALTMLGLLIALVWSLGRGTGPDPGGAAARPAAAGPVTINIAYGTEKKKWLEAALREFRGTPAGRRCRVNLVGMGSVEGAQAILDGPGSTPIHVWTPPAAPISTSSSASGPSAEAARRSSGPATSR